MLSPSAPVTRSAPDIKVHAEAWDRARTEANSSLIAEIQSYAASALALGLTTAEVAEDLRDRHPSLIDVSVTLVPGCNGPIAHIRIVD